MRILAICLSLSILAAAAVTVAQQPAAQSSAPPAMKTFISSADIQDLIVKAKNERKPDQGIFSQRLVQLAPYNVNLEYRGIQAPVSIHEREAELFYFVQGTATLVTGGTIVGEDQKKSIEGGTSQVVNKGDIAFIPQNTPHWIRNGGDGVVVDISFHLPRPVPSYAELEKLLP